MPPNNYIEGLGQPADAEAMMGTNTNAKIYPDMPPKTTGDITNQNNS